MNLQICMNDSIAASSAPRRQHLILLLVALLISACSVSNYGDDQASAPPRRGMISADSDTAAIQGFAGMLVPPSDWWRQAEIADVVKPTADQVAALDKLQTDQGDEILRLQRDIGVAERDLRNVLESDKPTTDAIISAGDRIKTMRDDIFDRQLRFLAAQRTILTREQWSALQDAVRAQRRDRIRDGMGRGAGRGGYPGRGGRRPGGFPGW